MSDIKYNCTRCNDTGYAPTDYTKNGILYSGVSVCGCKYPSLKAATFGDRYKDKTLENYEGRTPSMESAKLQLITNPDHSYFITGAVGLGKTHLMAGIYDRIVRKYGAGVAVFTEAQLSDRIRYKDDVADPRNFKVAMVDDIGKIKLTDWQYDKFFEYFLSIYRKRSHLVIKDIYLINRYT